MVSMEEARELSLSLPETQEEPHHGMPSFRVRGKIFATVPDGQHLRVMVEPELARAAADGNAACELLWWGKRIAGVIASLATIEREPLAELLEQAWRRRAPRALVKARDDESGGHA